MSIDANFITPKLLANLSVPSTVHGYSLGVEYMKNWFLTKFKKNFFKPESIHINGKHIFDDFRRFNTINEKIKRPKPTLVITPNIQLDLDDDRIDLYSGGLDLFIKRSKWQNSFIRDNEKKIYLAFNMQTMTMSFNFRTRVTSRAQQLDLYRFMELAFRIGATQGQDLELDFHIPHDLMVMFASDAGFVENGQITDHMKFLAYLNSHSQIPILYKLRTINGNNEYFVRMSRMYTHISCLDKLSIDDGEREGMLDNNYMIEMNCILRMPVPQFYIYYSIIEHEEQLIQTEMNPGNLGVYSFKYDPIPNKNEQLWDLFLTTDYESDSYDSGLIIDIGELLKYKELWEVIEYNVKSLFISPSVFVDIKVFNGSIKPIKSTIDWKTLQLTINEPLATPILSIGIYVDLEYLNEQLVIIKKMNNSRLK